MKIQTIEPRTERLQLRQWACRDRDSFAAMSAGPQMLEFFPGSLNRSESDAIVDTCEGLISERGLGGWAAELLEAREFIGFIGLHIPHEELPPSPCVEILWRLAPSHCGYGYATEGVTASLDVGFKPLDLTEIVFFAVPSNHRSRAVMERLKMTSHNSRVQKAFYLNPTKLLGS
ncbi:hypothetical protein A9Q99_19645 [Gammaproteobacteria bacterium 45_16_T64]|nr:hypothetical protein A9Q99_19645 [Gammaproteobacteria bacterium 45_16_T64]